MKKTMMKMQLEVEGIAIDLVLKKIRNVHLSVHPPEGRVRISAPYRMSYEQIRRFTVGNLDWIKRQQEKAREVRPETNLAYVDHEEHFVWGNRHVMTVLEKNEQPSVTLNEHGLVLNVRPGADISKRQAVLHDWYRQQLDAALPELLATWEPIVDVKVKKIVLQRMKSRWGTCYPREGLVRLNTELAKRPPQCLEYVLVHELIHFWVHNHGPKFRKLMDKHLPHWRSIRMQLKKPLTEF